MMYPIPQPPRQLAYAPTPYAPYTPNPLSTTISLDEEVKLPTSTSERDIFDSLAEIYSILIALEGLEKAFNKDSVTDAEYTELCSRLIKQYKGNLSDERVLAQFKDLDHFRAEWKVDCPRAAERINVKTTDDERPTPEEQPQPMAKKWTVEEKLRVLVAAQELADDELGAFLRREGMHSAQLAEWRAAAVAAFDAKPARGSLSARRIKELEKELRRKERALAETAALLVLSKKMQALWSSKEVDDTDDGSET